MTTGVPRLIYFLRAAAREHAPWRWSAARNRLQRTLPRDLSDLPQDLVDRVNYCNAMTGPAPLPSTRLGDFRLSTETSNGKLYHIDLGEVALGFGPEARLAKRFGDVTEVPDSPTFVKSRPVAPGGDMAAVSNSVLLPLNRLRHMNFPKDPVPWEAKKPTAVWRGRIHSQETRRAAVTRYSGRSDHDIGHIQTLDGLPPPKGWLTMAQQLRHRYILSLEGFDVATNLKWIMGSSSVALSPRLEYETWYMEGRLQPGVHFVEIAPDMSDLDERVAWCEANPEAVRQIVKNANDWTRQFRDPAIERLVATLVIQKYVELTGGLELTSSPRKLFT